MKISIDVEKASDKIQCFFVQQAKNRKELP